jgi:4-hydroxy-tetrahydrodipicolinate synthase
MLSGDDATALPFLAQGGHGCISVTSNLVPGLCRAMYLACRQGQITRAQRLSVPIARLTAALFRESSPVPLKYALSLLGLITPKVRLPLVEPSNETKIAVTAAMEDVCEGYAEYFVERPQGAERIGRGAIAS